MQRQKTIAKWLAIILLLTLAVASYATLSAVLSKKTSPENVAGAQPDEGLPAGDDNNNNNSIDDGDMTSPPVYSTFPREAVLSGGIQYAHIGGENEDVLEDYIRFGGRDVLIFSTRSTQYDVRGEGIWAAAMDGAKLTGVYPLAASGEKYADCTTFNGKLLCATRDADGIKLRLFDENFDAVKTSSLPYFESCAFFTNAGELKLYACSDKGIEVFRISRELGAVRCGQGAELGGATIAAVMPAGDTDVVFACANNSVYIYTFSLKTDFIYQNQLPESRFMQIMPMRTDNKNTFALLCEKDGDIIVSGVDENGKDFASYAIKGESDAAMYMRDGKAVVVTKSNKYIFCTHIEPPVVAPLSLIGDIAAETEFDYIPTADINKIVFAKTSAKLYALKIGDDGLETAAVIDGVKDALLVPAYDSLRIAYDGVSGTDFLDGFGLADVFYMIDNSAAI